MYILKYIIAKKWFVTPLITDLIILLRAPIVRQLTTYLLTIPSISIIYAHYKYERAYITV